LRRRGWLKEELKGAILHLNNHGAKVGGAEAFIWDLINYTMALTRFKCYYATADGANSTVRVLNLKNIGPQRLHRLWFGLRRISLELFNRALAIDDDPLSHISLCRLIQDVNPNVVHLHNISHLSYSTVLQVLHRKAVNSLATCHDFTLICPKQDLLTSSMEVCDQRDWSKCVPCLNKRLERKLSPIVSKRLTQQMERRVALLKDADVMLIAPCEAMKHVFARYQIPLNNIKVIYYGVDTGKFRPVKTKKNPPPYVLFTGRLMKNKGILDYLQVASQYKRKYGDEVKFKLIGGYVRNPHVQSLGWLPRDALPTYYSQSLAVLALTYVPPGIGLAPLEAMACGSALIAYKVPGAEEFIQDGENGLLVEPGDLNGIVEKIRMLKENGKFLTEIRRKARENVERKFPLEKALKNYLTLYRSFILGES
jgi:glycosyltransferase involved in cell wall biosynthesis